MKKHRLASFRYAPAPPLPPFDPSAAYDRALPVWQKRADILAALASHQVLVIAGETGSGKTTQVPLLCLEAGRGTRGTIAVTQPRRIAATSLAAYTARRMQCQPGSLVGHRVRFDEKTSDQTRIVYLTDGMLLTDIAADPLLRRYDTIILDEAHERSLTIDFLLGFLRRLLPRRPDLSLIISSATIDTSLFSQAFSNAPVIEVSGRLFPVEIIYQPPLEDELESGYVDGAVKAVRTLIDMREDGDLLVFMPTAQDITEAVNRIVALREQGTLVLPLYGRLSAAEQNRVFSPHNGRKIIVCTNIAETSLTVPGIRFVIDTGLARTVRYNPQTRTTRMPVEPIPQSSANQRAGRCGRVQDGICIRLYGHSDYLERDLFATAEIHRANLAGVVLQMAALGLGDVETFPFLQPPSTRSIAEGRRQLRELGALDERNGLTPLGRSMSRLPLDPCIARMLLQASQEGCMREMLVIAAGLSVIDPRERPQDRQEKADLAHKRFIDPHSDFLMYLALWDTYREQWDQLKTQSKMRAFCRDHFLSFVRMREWFDIYHQIEKSLQRFESFKITTQKASYEAIHRSLLSGLLMNVALKGEAGEYTATRGRQVHIFPGSALNKGGHRWIVCHEIVETSRVFARTVARIEPEWIEQVVPHMCRKSWSEPWFDETTGAVRAFERVSFFGLPLIERRKVFYGRINPQEASTVFIVEGLVAARLRTHHPFLKHNTALRAQIEQAEAKVRSHTLYAGDSAQLSFYGKHLDGVAGEHDLNRRIKELGGDTVLKMHLNDLVCDQLPATLDNYPDRIVIGGYSLDISYVFDESDPLDGITVRVPEKLLGRIHAHAFEWLLPVLWPRRIESLIDCLPKHLRRQLQPTRQISQEAALQLKEAGVPFAQAVREVLSRNCSGDIPPDYARTLEPHPAVWLRVAIIDVKGNVLETGITPNAPQRIIGVAKSTDSADPFAEHARSGLQTWDFDVLPVQLEYAGKGHTLFGYPALNAAKESVDIVVFSRQPDAQRAHYRGVMRLFELGLATELAWLSRDMRLPRAEALLCAPFAGVSAIEKRLVELALAHVLHPGEPLPRNRAQFDKELHKRRELLRRCAHETVELLSQILYKLKAAYTVLPPAGPLLTKLRNDLDAYRAAIFEPDFSYRRLLQYPRYLSAYAQRIALAKREPAKFRERLTELDTCLARIAELDTTLPSDNWTVRDLHEEICLMAQELAISLFAQQSVKTLYPVSQKRIDEKIESLRRIIGQIHQ